MKNWVHKLKEFKIARVKLYVRLMVFVEQGGCEP